MPSSPPQISAKILAKLAVVAPGLSCEPGTPERGIIDAVAETISEASVNQYLCGAMFDIDSMTGLQLEEFVGIYGFGRLQGKAATGVVRVTLSNVAPQDYQIPLGSQFFTRSGVNTNSNTGMTQLYFSSTQAEVLPAGSLTIDVPVKCSVVGTVGNVPPDTITYLGSVIGSGSATNLTALTGGVDVETDAELRQRFRDTLLRNIAGTADWYKSLCLQNNSVSRVAVYGITSLYRTQIQAPTTTLALNLSQDVKYVFPKMTSCYSNIGQEDEVFYSDTYDYNLSSGASPVFTRIDSGQIADGDIVGLEFQYTTECSRNDPTQNPPITNKVDVFVDGIDPVSVTEQTVIQAVQLSSSSTSPYYTGNFERIGSDGTPSANNRFMRLGSVPIVSFPSTIAVGETIYTRGQHYHLLKDITTNGGSSLEVSGIEWTDDGPSTGQALTLTYIYNQTPELLAHIMSSSKQVATDVMVHQANFQYVTPCLNVEYETSYSIATVNTAIDSALKVYFSSLGYGAQFKISSLTGAVQQVLGVASVELTTSSDNATNYGVQLRNSSSDPTPHDSKTDDFKFLDNTLPVFVKTVIIRKAAP